MTVTEEYDSQTTRRSMSLSRDGGVGSVGDSASDRAYAKGGTTSSAYEEDQDNAYLTELLSYSLDRLNKEPSLLKDDQDVIRRQMQDSAASHHRAFVEAAQHLSAVRDQVGTVNTHLQGMLEKLPFLEDTSSAFSEQAEKLLEKRRLHKQLQANHAQLLELLEVPQLMDTCVRNANYDEALDLEAFISKMAFLHPELAVVKALHREAKATSQAMLAQLLKRLSGSIQLPECLRVIGFLRRLSVFTEPELRLQFLQCREEWLVELVAELDTHNPYDYIKRLTDIHRLHLFDVVMQYKAIFSDEASPGEASGAHESQILTSWAQHRVCLYMEALNAHLPRIKEGGSLSSVLEHSMYCGMSLGRVGLDFRGLLPPVFESCMAALFSSALANALDSFHLSLERHKWMSMPAIPYGAMKRSNSKGSEASVDGADGSNTASASDGMEDLSPPQVLMEHLPLAVFVNSLLQAFNELRHCTPMTLGGVVAQSLQDAVLAVSSTMAHFHSTRVFGEAEEPIFESACRVVVDVVAPYVVACYTRLYPGNPSQLDAVAATQPLQEIVAAAKAKEAATEAAAQIASSAATAKLKKSKPAAGSSKGGKPGKPAAASAATTIAPPPPAAPASAAVEGAADTVEVP